MTCTMQPHTRRFLAAARRGSPFITAALMVGAMGLTAPSARALTEEQIKAICDATGGVYETRFWSFGRQSECCYHSTEGGIRCNRYWDGELVSSDRQVPSDIATATVNQPPPRPIQVPPDIATAPTVSQAPG